MTESRKFYKIALKSKVATIEEEEFNETDTSYVVEFNEDFADELAYLESMFTPPSDPDTESLSQDPDDEPHQKETEARSLFKESFKKIHRELAKVTHPDLNTDSEDKDFKKMQEAYEKSDGATLIELALDNNVNIELDQENAKKIEEGLDARTHNLLEKKKSVRWAWCTSDKNIVIRLRIKQLLNINEVHFQTWLLKRS